MTLPRILIASFGSHGDVLPFAALAAEFVRRGHRVHFFANPYFEAALASRGAQFRPVGEVADYHRLFAQLSDAKPDQAMARVAQELAALLAPCYEAMRAEVDPAGSVLIGSALQFSHRLAAETTDMPCATVHLAPAAIRSTLRPARVGPHALQELGSGTPRALKRLAWWLMDKAFMEPHFRAPLNLMRARLGLAPVRDLFEDWIHRSDALLGLFPAWFAQPPADWPAHLQLLDFPLDDPATAAPLPPALQAFLAAGPAPVGFSAGTATATARGFFAESAQACVQAGLRGLLFSHFPEQVPAQLPPQLLHVPFAPYARLLPQLAALVHHGGIGTSAQALRAGLPQLVRPQAYDQFDNARRLIDLGVARELLPAHYRADRAASALTALLGDAALRARCQALAPRLQGPGHAMTQACEAILARCAPQPAAA
ncbi:MAG: glycosyltransferase [Inhella sp.]